MKILKACGVIVLFLVIMAAFGALELDRSPSRMTQFIALLPVVGLALSLFLIFRKDPTAKHKAND